jgi:hypothetical protein
MPWAQQAPGIRGRQLHAYSIHASASACIQHTYSIQDHFLTALASHLAKRVRSMCGSSGREGSQRRAMLLLSLHPTRHAHVAAPQATGGACSQVLTWLMPLAAAAIPSAEAS